MIYPQLNYLRQVKGYWIAHNAHSLGIEEVGLYFHLLEISNTLRWMNPFKRNNSKVMSDLGIRDRRTLDRYRNRLKQAGIIDFETKNGDANVTYKLIDLSIFCTGFGIGDGIGSSIGSGIGDGIDNTNKTKGKHSIPASNEAGRSNDPPDSLQKKNKKSEKVKNPLYTACISQYDKFIRSRTDNGAKIDGAQGTAMKNIIAYLTTQVKAKNKQLTDDDVPEKVIESWNLILDNWSYLNSFLQGRLRLVDINSELTNILSQVRNGINSNTNSRDAAGKAAGATGSVRKGGATLDDLESLKRNTGPGNSQRTEFTDAEVVK